jgi:cell division septum initiation protein DivIVA
MYEAENAFIDSLITDINHLKDENERLEKENAELKEKLKELKENK